MCSTLLDSTEAVEVLCSACDDSGIEFRIDAHRIGDLPEQVDTLRGMVTHCELPDIEMRFHFPLGPFELSHIEDEQAARALSLMQASPFRTTPRTTASIGRAICWATWCSSVPVMVCACASRTCGGA
jgi:hypothetical protein